MGRKKRKARQSDSESRVGEELPLEGLEEEGPEMEPLLEEGDAGPSGTTAPESMNPDTPERDETAASSVVDEGAGTVDPHGQADLLDAAGADDLYEHDYYGTGLEPVPHLFELAEPASNEWVTESIEKSEAPSGDEPESGPLPEPPSAEEVLELTPEDQEPPVTPPPTAEEPEEVAVPASPAGPTRDADVEEAAPDVHETAPSAVDETVDEVPDTEPETPDPLAEALRRAAGLAGAGKISEAMAAYRRLALANPESSAARNGLGLLLLEAGENELALDEFKRAWALDGEQVDILVNLAAALTALGRYEEAERELRRALRAGPDHGDVRLNLGILLFRRGLYAQSEAELRWVAGRYPETATAHLYLGEVLNRLGRFDEAQASLERTVELDPENARAYQIMGFLFDRRAMPEQASAMYRKAREFGRP